MGKREVEKPETDSELLKQIRDRLWDIQVRQNIIGESLDDYLQEIAILLKHIIRENMKLKVSSDCKKETEND